MRLSAGSGACPVNTMARPASSAALITSSSRIEPPGWITAVAPASAAASRPSAKGKKASDATTEPLARVSAEPRPSRRLGRLPGGDARGIDAAHLAGADADRRAVPGVDDGVRLDVLGDAEGEEQVGHLALGRRALASPPSVPCRRRRRCRAPAPGSRPRRCASTSPRRARIGQAAGHAAGAGSSCAATMRDRLVVGVRRDDHLGEDLDDLAAASASSRRFSATMPPKAETGSQRSALA